MSCARGSKLGFAVSEYKKDAVADGAIYTFVTKKPLTTLAPTMCILEAVKSIIRAVTGGSVSSELISTHTSSPSHRLSPVELMQKISCIVNVLFLAIHQIVSMATMSKGQQTARLHLVYMISVKKYAI